MTIKSRMPINPPSIDYRDHLQQFYKAELEKAAGRRHRMLLRERQLVRRGHEEGLTMRQMARLLNRDRATIKRFIDQEDGPPLGVA